MDDLTRKLAGAYRLSRPSDYVYGGFHSCRCGALSDNTDHLLPDGTRTNSLCVHYVAYHRQEVPEADLEFVRRLSAGGVDPTKDELRGQRVIDRPFPEFIDRLRQENLEPPGK